MLEFNSSKSLSLSGQLNVKPKHKIWETHSSGCLGKEGPVTKKEIKDQKKDFLPKIKETPKGSKDSYSLQDKVNNADSAFIFLIILLISRNGQSG